MAKPLLNINIPKVGRIKTRDVLYVAVISAGLIAAWNWSNKIPYVGPYAVKAKTLIVKALGFQYPLDSALV